MKPESAERLVRRNLNHEAAGYRFISDKRLTVWQPMMLSEEQVQEFIPRITAPVLMIEGNSGFTAHWHYLPERYRLSLGGKTVLIEHGDLLCTDDHGYQRLRRILRCRCLQRLYYRLPARLRLAIAEKLRGQSRKRSRHANAPLSRRIP